MEKIAENHDVLKEITHEFDSNVGSLLLNIMTLKNIDIELGHISEDVLNTDKTNPIDMALMFRDMEHKIHLLADLLHYTVKDLEETYKQTKTIKSSYFDLIIRANEKADARTSTQHELDQE